MEQVLLFYIHEQSKAYTKEGEDVGSTFFVCASKSKTNRIIRAVDAQQVCAMAEKLQTYVSQPSEDLEGWEVAKFREELSNYVPLKGEFYPTEELAKERARVLNETAEE